MHTLQVREKTGEDGVLHLLVPLGRPNLECDVVVVVQPKDPGGRRVSPEELGWPAGYFDRTFGSITDETFQRQPQGEMPPPVELG